MRDDINLFRFFLNIIKYWIVVMLLFSQAILLAQTENWVYRLNGAGNDDDIAQSVIYGYDGNIYSAGYTTGVDHNFAVVSLDSSGNERWTYGYNGPGAGDDEAWSIAQGIDLNIYAAGFSTGSGTGRDLTVISLTSNGAERWIYRYNGSGNDEDVAYSISCGADGNIYVAGWSMGNANFDLTVVSLADSGSERWVYRYNGPGDGHDGANRIVYGTNGDIYVAGSSIGNSLSYDFTVLCLSDSGIEEWIYRYNGPANGTDQAICLVEGSDGNIYAGGTSWGGISTLYEFTVASVTNDGSERWVYRYNGPADQNEGANDIVYGLDGNVYAGGWTVEPGMAFANLAVLSFTNTGSFRWIYTYHFPGTSGGEIFSMDAGLDSNVYAAGFCYSGGNTLDDFVVVSLTGAGSENWLHLYDGPGSSWDGAYALMYGADGNIYASGYSEGISTDNDFTVICITPPASCKLDKNRLPPVDIIFPTFFHDKLVLRLSSRFEEKMEIFLFDASGRVVYRTQYFSLPREITLSGKGLRVLPPGIYFISLVVEKRIIRTAKVVKF